ncbi:unnamed protein product [Euphydryas editha]|uniref:Ig-like domain-containing protein n=1 Tax=Euphydryas editha TaxID=104508 RepID=A0AAU9U8L4_EUPED|nr:unnamed protein product [Euphydryas editha]
MKYSYSCYSYGQKPTLVSRNEGEILTMGVLTFNDEVEKCYLVTPQGSEVELKLKDELNDKFELVSDEIPKCRVNLKNIDVNDAGLWTINAVNATGTILSQSYDLRVIPRPDDTPEISTTPTVDTPAPNTHVIENLPSEYIDTKLGASHTVLIKDYAFVTSRKCFIITPSGRQYNLQELNLPNVKVINHREATCAINVTVNSEDSVGNWTLVAEGRRYSDDIIRKLQFTIHVEETVDASLRDVIVVEGNDFYVRLRNPIHNYDTCSLLGPDGKEYDTYEIDNRYVESCGYIVRNVHTNDSGNWEIVYGDSIIYRAPINVTVNVATSDETANLIWTKHRPVDTTLGAEDAVYCRLRNPEGLIAYDGSGRCRVVIDRVTTAHSGIWKINVGLPGRVLTKNSEINVTVVEADSKPVVETQVVVDRPSVSLTCKVSSPYPIRTCKFRDPSGRVLLANEGVGESRYSFHGSGVSYHSNLHSHDCGLLITDPIVQDLGLWRCSVETEGDTYYGFLRVLAPWVMRDPEVAATIVMEPTLTADRNAVSTVVGDSVSMSCSIQSAIRYCYFRARNGSVFNIGPAQQHDQATYVGAGFDAGECGIRFPSLAVSDSGVWSCHIGPLNAQGEQRVQFNVSVYDSMVADQRRIMGGGIIVEAQVFNQRALEYCRFVRIDGLGFTSENTPKNYSDVSNLSQGRCAIVIPDPSILDHHPWTVAARIRGQEVELSRVTQITLPTRGALIYYHLPVTWIVLIAVGLSMILLSIGPKSNRRWTYARASAIRNSFIKKKVEQQNIQPNNNDRNTANAA